MIQLFFAQSAQFSIHNHTVYKKNIFIPGQSTGHAKKGRMIRNASKYEYFDRKVLSHGFSWKLCHVVKIFGWEPLLRMIFVVPTKLLSHLISVIVLTTTNQPQIKILMLGGI